LFIEIQLKTFNEAIWKITASLVLTAPSVDERLVFALTRAPLKLFMAEPMKKIVDCWNWLLSARPDLESLFLLDMIAAWHSAQQVSPVHFD
jgi:phosphatidylinositol 4-kinase